MATQGGATESPYFGPGQRTQWQHLKAAASLDLATADLQEESGRKYIKSCVAG